MFLYSQVVPGAPPPQSMSPWFCWWSEVVVVIDVDHDLIESKKKTGSVR